MIGFVKQIRHEWMCWSAVIILPQEVAHNYWEILMAHLYLSGEDGCEFDGDSRDLLQRQGCSN